MRVRTGESEAARVTMGRVAGTLFVAGTALTVVGILLPHSPKADVVGFWGLAAATALGALLLYLWVALYAAYFFSRRAMARQLGGIGALYGGVLVVINPGPVALTRWLI